TPKGGLPDDPEDADRHPRRPRSAQGSRGQADLGAGQRLHRLRHLRAQGGPAQLLRLEARRGRLAGDQPLPGDAAEPAGGLGQVRASALAAVSLFALAGCGSSSRSPSSGPSSSASSGQSAAPTVISTATAKGPKLHGAKVLVDSRGFVLYTFSKD